MERLSSEGVGYLEAKLERIETDDTYPGSLMMYHLTWLVVPLANVCWGQSNVHAFVVQLYMPYLLGYVTLVVGPNTNEWLGRYITGLWIKYTVLHGMDRSHPSTGGLQRKEQSPHRGRHYILGCLLTQDYMMRPCQSLYLTIFHCKLQTCQPSQTCELFTWNNSLYRPHWLFSGKFPPIPHLFI